MSGYPTDLESVVRKEIETARSSSVWNKRAHVLSIAIVIIAGGLTAYFAAIKFDTAYVTAGLAFITTLAGTFEKTFSFGKNAAGYREAKTRFQNLRLEFLRHEGELTDEERNKVIDELVKIRLLKAELTTTN